MAGQYFVEIRANGSVKPGYGGAKYHWKGLLSLEPHLSEALKHNILRKKTRPPHKLGTPRSHTAGTKLTLPTFTDENGKYLRSKQKTSFGTPPFEGTSYYCYHKKARPHHCMEGRAQRTRKNEIGEIKAGSREFAGRPKGGRGTCCVDFARQVLAAPLSSLCPSVTLFRPLLSQSLGQGPFRVSRVTDPQ